MLDIQQQTKQTMFLPTRIGVEGKVVNYNEKKKRNSKVRGIESVKGGVILNKEVSKDLSIKVIFE